MLFVHQEFFNFLALVILIVPSCNLQLRLSIPRNPLVTDEFPKTAGDLICLALFKSHWNDLGRVIVFLYYTHSLGIGKSNAFSFH